MRMAFGLVGLLVVIGIIVWILSAAYLPHTQQVLATKKKIEPQVQQITGHSADGEDARQSIKLDSETSGGKMTSVVVTQITAGGGMEKYFGLQKGDSIVAIATQGGAEMPVKEMASAAEAKDYLLTSYQNQQHIVVMRGDQKITLPAAGGDSSSSLEKQLQGIKVPTH
jgi:hypothetical protein